jgi:hypothetical protein
VPQRGGFFARTDSNAVIREGAADCAQAILLGPLTLLDGRYNLTAELSSVSQRKRCSTQNEMDGVFVDG